ncbi:MAG: GNAT family N-acetyltransferase [Pseudomonadota bacterium]
MVQIRREKRLPPGIDGLVETANAEGYQHVWRLRADYVSGDNVFSAPGEALFGVYADGGTLVGIGGVNRDPYSARAGAGRIRRGYIAPAWRRGGCAAALLRRIEADAGATLRYCSCIPRRAGRVSFIWRSATIVSMNPRFPTANGWRPCRSRLHAEPRCPAAL